MNEKLRELKRYSLIIEPNYTRKDYVLLEDVENLINTPKHETVNFTLEDIISVKTALTKIGVLVPETNDLSNIQVINLFRLLALQASKRIYE